MWLCERAGQILFIDTSPSPDPDNAKTSGNKADYGTDESDPKVQRIHWNDIVGTGGTRLTSRLGGRLIKVNVEVRVIRFLNQEKANSN
jgi:hypothetical protein